MFNRFFYGPMFEAAASDGAAGGGDGAGADKAGAFDAAAFRTEMLSEFNKTLNGFAKTFKADVVKLVTPRAADPVVAVDPVVDPAAKVDPEKNALALELKTLKATFGDKFKLLEEREVAALAKADLAERDSLIRAELGKFTYASPKAAETAFVLVKGAVKRAEDGSLVANDLPLAKFIETELPTNHSYLLAAKDTGSAGARSGNSGTGGKQYTMADLDPATFQKKTPAEQAEIRKQIYGALNFGA